MAFAFKTNAEIPFAANPLSRPRLGNRGMAMLNIPPTPPGTSEQHHAP